MNRTPAEKVLVEFSRSVNDGNGNFSKMAFQLVLSTDDKLIRRDEDGDEEIGVSAACALTGMGSKELLQAAYPGRIDHKDGSYGLTITYGQSTGVFYRDQIAHEWRIGFFPEGIELAVSTHGGWNLWPVKHLFQTELEARDWLTRHADEMDKYDLENSAE